MFPAGTFPLCSYCTIDDFKQSKTLGWHSKTKQLGQTKHLYWSRLYRSLKQHSHTHTLFITSKEHNKDSGWPVQATKNWPIILCEVWVQPLWDEAEYKYGMFPDIGARPDGFPAGALSLRVQRCNILYMWPLINTLFNKRFLQLVLGLPMKESG